MAVPFWTRGDLNAFFGLGINMLVNVLVLAGLCTGVVHMFIVTLVIMLPTYLATKDPVKAWEAGLAWAFIIGCIILIGAFVGPAIRHFTPRAAMLGTLAGISLTFIS